jgi:hypothetical protein
MERVDITDAHSRTLPKWNIYVVRSAVFVFICETLGHIGELIPGYKPRYKLEVLLFHFRQEMAVCSRYNTFYPELEVPGISSVCLWTHK